MIRRTVVAAGSLLMILSLTLPLSNKAQNTSSATGRSPSGRHHSAGRPMRQMRQKMKSMRREMRMMRMRRHQARMQRHHRNHGANNPAAGGPTTGSTATPAAPSAQ